MKVLFVGGPWDRRLVDVDEDRPYIFVLVRQDRPDCFERQEISIMRNVEYKKVVYQRHEPIKGIVLYLFERMRLGDAMMQFVRSYATADYNGAYDASPPDRSAATDSPAPPRPAGG